MRATAQGKAVVGRLLLVIEDTIPNPNLILFFKI